MPLSKDDVRWCVSGIEAFLSNRTQQVLVDGATSDRANVVSGVPQGTVLSPLLFLIFINDLPECVTSNIRLFADDAIVYKKNDFVSWLVILMFLFRNPSMLLAFFVVLSM
jgi:hypothetical protein